MQRCRVHLDFFFWLSFLGTKFSHKLLKSCTVWPQIGRYCKHLLSVLSQIKETKQIKSNWYNKERRKKEDTHAHTHMHICVSVPDGMYYKISTVRFGQENFTFALLHTYKSMLGHSQRIKEEFISFLLTWQFYFYTIFLSIVSWCCIEFNKWIIPLNKLSFQRFFFPFQSWTFLPLFFCTYREIWWMQFENEMNAEFDLSKW